MIGKITSASLAGGKALEVRWDDGAVGLVNLAAAIDSRANLAPLNDPTEFARVRLSEDGWPLEWPCGIHFGAQQLRVWAAMRAPADADI